MLPPGYQRRLLRMQLQAACVGVAAALAVLATVPLVIVLSPLLIPLWLAAEAVFTVRFWAKLRQLNRIATWPEEVGADPIHAFQRFMESHWYITNTVTLEEYMATWFPGVPMSQLGSGNAAEMLAQGFFYKSKEDLDAEGRGHIVDAMLQQLQVAWSARYNEGTNPSAAFPAHLLEPLKTVYKPLAFYAGGEVAAALKHVLMVATGFQCHTHAGYTYYTYKMPSTAQRLRGEQHSVTNKEPLVFLHGVGAGLLPYIHFVQRLAATGHPVVAVEYKHLSMRWTDHMPDADQVAADMLDILDLHGIGRATLVSHSFGTLFTSCMLKQAPERAFKVVMVDPVCCCMWSGHLVANFVYKPHKTSLLGAITWFISRDIHTAAAVQRNFYWTHYNLWPQELPADAVVVLSGRDSLVPVHHVEAMLQYETRAHVLKKEHYNHADFLFSSSWQDTIVSATVQMIKAAARRARAPSSSSIPSVISEPYGDSNSSSGSLSDDGIVAAMSRSSSMVSSVSGAGLGSALRSSKAFC